MASDDIRITITPATRPNTGETTLHGSEHTIDIEKIGLAIGSPSQACAFNNETRHDRHGLRQALASDFNEKIGVAIGSPSQAEIDSEFPRRSTPISDTDLPNAQSKPDTQSRLQVVAAFFLFMNSWGLINAFGEYQTYYRRELLRTHSNSAISWIGSTRAFLLLASPLLWGPLFDQGYLRSIVIGGSLLVVAGELCGSFCDTLGSLLFTQGIMMGLGGGACFLAAIANLPMWWSKEKRGFVLGVAAAGVSLGGVVYPIMFWRLQPQVGFAWATRCIASVVAITSIVPCALVRYRSVPTQRRAILDWTVFHDLRFNVWCLAWFFGNAAMYVPFFLIQQYGAVVAGFHPDHAFWLLIIMNAASTSGRILPGKIADKLGDPLLMIGVSAAASTILAFSWTAIRAATPGVFLFSALYGFCSAAFVSLSPAATVALAPSTEGIGTRMGMFNFAGALGLLVGSPIAGYIVERSWFGMQVFVGVISAIACCSIVVTWLLARKRR